MGVRNKNLYIDNEGVKRCKFLGEIYPEACLKCKHSVSIFCGCDYEEYHGEGVGIEKI